MVSLLVRILDCGSTSRCAAALVKSRCNLSTEQPYSASRSWQVQLINRTSRAQSFFSWCSQCSSELTATHSAQLCSRGGLAALMCISDVLGVTTRVLHLQSTGLGGAMCLPGWLHGETGQGPPPKDSWQRHTWITSHGGVKRYPLGHT